MLLLRYEERVPNECRVVCAHLGKTRAGQNLDSKYLAHAAHKLDECQGVSCSQIDGPDAPHAFLCPFRDRNAAKHRGLAGTWDKPMKAMPPQKSIPHVKPGDWRQPAISRAFVYQATSCRRPDSSTQEPVHVPARGSETSTIPRAHLSTGDVEQTTTVRLVDTPAARRIRLAWASYVGHLTLADGQAVQVAACSRSRPR